MRVVAVALATLLYIAQVVVGFIIAGLTVLWLLNFIWP